MTADETTRETVDERTGEIRRVRPFAEWVREVAHGELHDEIGQTLVEVVHAVSVYRKPGKVTVTFDIKPLGDGQKVEVVGACDAKLPKPDREGSLFFLDRDSNMIRQDPNQTVMPWGTRPVPRPQQPDATQEAGK